MDLIHSCPSFVDGFSKRLASNPSLHRLKRSNCELFPGQAVVMHHYKKWMNECNHPSLDLLSDFLLGPSFLLKFDRIVLNSALPCWVSTAFRLFLFFIVFKLTLLVWDLSRSGWRTELCGQLKCDKPYFSSFDLRPHMTMAMAIDMAAISPALK